MASRPTPPPILDLNTLIERPQIAVDGARYQLMSPEELSVLDSQQLGIWGREIDRLSRDGDAEDASALSGLIDTAARKVLVDMPAAVFERLSGAHRMDIVSVFSMLLLRRRARVAGAMTERMATTTQRPTGAKSFPGSSASTAASPDTGSPAPRRR